MAKEEPKINIMKEKNSSSIREKIVVAIAILLIVAGCGSEAVEVKPVPTKYNKGDIVYLKPDSVKFVITLAYNRDWNDKLVADRYSGYYHGKNGEMYWPHEISNTVIFGKVEH